MLDSHYIDTLLHLMLYHMNLMFPGMEARYKCCIAINKALSASSIRNDGALAEISTKVCLSSIIDRVLPVCD